MLHYLVACAVMIAARNLPKVDNLDSLGTWHSFTDTCREIAVMNRLRIEQIQQIERLNRLLESGYHDDHPVSHEAPEGQRMEWVTLPADCCCSVKLGMSRAEVEQRLFKTLHIEGHGPGYLNLYYDCLCLEIELDNHDKVIEIRQLRTLKTVK